MATPDLTLPASQPPVSTGIAGPGHAAPRRLHAEPHVPGGRPARHRGKTTIAMQFLLEGRERGEAGLYVALSETANELRAVGRVARLDARRHRAVPAADAAQRRGRGAVHPLPSGRGRARRHRPGPAGDRRSPAAVPHRPRLAQRAEAAGARSAAVPPPDPGPEDLLRRHGHHGPAAGRSGRAARTRSCRASATACCCCEQLPFEYGRARRRLRVVKFRGVAAIEGFHDFTINRGGVAVFPQIEPPGQSEVSPQPVESGIAEMDRLLGGGLAWGTTTLFIGPSGSGKSTLATQYVAHGREPGLDLPVRRAHAHLPAALRRAGHAAVGADRQRRGSGPRRSSPASSRPASSATACGATSTSTAPA